MSFHSVLTWIFLTSYAQEVLFLGIWSTTWSGLVMVMSCQGHQNSCFEWLDRKFLLLQFNQSNLDSGRGCISYELIMLYVLILTAYTTWLNRSNWWWGGRRPQLGCWWREGHWGSNFACWRGGGGDQGNWSYPLSTKYWSPTSRFCWGWV